MITAEFEIELLCFIRTYELKGYTFFMVRKVNDGEPNIQISVNTPGHAKEIKAKESINYRIVGMTFTRSSQEDLEHFIKTVKLYDRTYNKRAA